MSRRGLAVIALGVGAALLVAAGLARSAGSASAAAKTRKGGMLRMSALTDVDFVDPALAWLPRSWQIGFATCAKLFNYPDAPGAAGTRLVKEVVDRFTVSKDRRTYTFVLKRSFRFHTGAWVTAQSFADAFNRVAKPKLESPATVYMREIVGATAVIDGEAQSISGVRVLDRYRLQIRLIKPVGDLTARLTMPFFCPVRPNTPIDPAGIDNPPGSGPYYVAERIVNQRIVLKRNPYYRGDRPANVDQIVQTLDNPDACLLAVEQDRIDYCYFGLAQVPYRALAEKYGINRPGGRFFVRPSLATQFVAFNHQRPAFKGRGQIPLKKAINFAIDRLVLARAFGYLAGKRTDQMLPPALARPASIYPLAGADPAKARNFLARARLRPTALVLYASNSPSGVAQAQMLVSSLKQIGIDLQVKYFDINVLNEKATTRGEPFDLILQGWGPDYADPAGFFVPLLSRGGQGGGGANLDDPRINGRIEATNRLTGEARRKAWADLDVDLMRNDPPWAPFLHATARTFVSKSVGCMLDHPVYGFDIAAVCKK
jgi:peptide/nickel transport system substrate-binding protein/oligopeptide transport system substrate-binding protein